MKNARFDPTPALQYFELSAEYRQLYEKSGGPYQMLAYCYDAQVVEMGHIARRGNGTFWWYTTNPKIYCKHTAGQELSLKEAVSGLFSHVREEVIRMFDLTRPVHYHDLPATEFRKSDAKVCALTGSDEDSFLAGMDWAFRTMGIRRRPSWAKYVVQNRDKSMFWFEECPVYDHNEGLWTETTARSEEVLIDAVPSKRIRRVK